MGSHRSDDSKKGRFDLMDVADVGMPSAAALTIQLILVEASEARL
jgi:hypothetical protein